MAKAAKKINAAVHKVSPPAVGENGTPPIKFLNLEAIVRAVRISRELNSIEGARTRWDWHPLYPDAVAILDSVDDS